MIGSKQAFASVSGGAVLDLALVRGFSDGMLNSAPGSGKHAPGSFQSMPKLLYVSVCCLNGVAIHRVVRVADLFDFGSDSWARFRRGHPDTRLAIRLPPLLHLRHPVGITKSTVLKPKLDHSNSLFKPSKTSSHQQDVRAAVSTMPLPPVIASPNPFSPTCSNSPLRLPTPFPAQHPRPRKNGEPSEA